MVSANANGWADEIAGLNSEFVVIDAPPQIGGATRAIVLPCGFACAMSPPWKLLLLSIRRRTACMAFTPQVRHPAPSTPSGATSDGCRSEAAVEKHE